MLVTMNIPPGVSGNGQQYQVGLEGRWWRGDLVRFRAGLLAPVGGWQIASDVPAEGAARGAHAWRDNRLRRRLAVGTHKALYTWGDSGTLVDVTPAGFPEGREDGQYADGFGIGPFGEGTFGDARTAASEQLLIDPTTWSMDNWGEHLVAVASHDKVLYEWEPDAAGVSEIANAPSARALVVTPERHLVALGAGGNPRRVAWSDREDNTEWTPTATNTAGDLEIQTQGLVQTAVRVRGETLILTDQDAHTMQFVGPPLVYGFERVGSGCGVASAHAAVALDGAAAWMGDGGFFTYDGAVRPLPSDVHDYVFSDINRSQLGKTHAGHNVGFSEVWWHYCSSASEEVDRYVIWNYDEKHWSMGQLSRTCWAPPGVFPRPVLAGTDGYLYEHESGWTANGQSLHERRWIESSAVGIGPGDRVMAVRRLIPDERTQGDTRVLLNARFAPNGPEYTFGPYVMDDFVDMRLHGRQVALRVEGAEDADWRIGVPRLDIVEGGRR